MGKMRFARLVAPILALGLATTACAGGSGGSGEAGGGNGQPVRGLEVIVPNSPGSGYDTTARAAAKAMEDAGLARSVEVSNVAGAGGTVGLQRVVNEKGNGDQLLQMGLGVVGAVYTNKSEATLQETTPVARLIEEAEAIVVPKDSPLKRVADLRGKRVALNKGSNVHYLLLRALEQAGVPYAEVQTVYLPPADARAAFERGSVDAWVIWDPFLAAAERQLGARVLADGTGLVANHQFYLASRDYAARRPDVLKAVVEELGRLDAWAAAHPKEVAQLLAPQIGLDLDITERSARRFAYGIRPVDAAVAREQQKIADAFHALKLIPRPLRIADALPAGVQVAAKP